MTATVRIPTPLRGYAGGAAEFEVGGHTVGEALAQLTTRHPALRAHLYAEDGSLRNFVSAYLNDEDVRHLKGPATPVREGDTITIVPSIAGGARDGGTPAGTVEAPERAEPSLMPGRRLAEGIAERAGAIELARDEVYRYSRHLIMPEVGLDGQRKLKAARVLLVGAGGLGSPLGLYLAAAGVGTLGIVDFDVVDETNLQRQVLHGTKDVGRAKLESARDRIRDVNPHVEVIPYQVRLTSENALEILEPYDVIVDGTDNFPTRYLVNDACVLLGKPNVYGSIFRFEGQLSVFYAKEGPCYRCLFREPPPPGLVPSCAEGGVLGVLPGIVGSLQALETIKLIVGGASPLIGRLLLFDGLAMRWRELKIRKNPECLVCGENPTVRGLIDYEEFCGVAVGQEVAEDEIPAITASELKTRLDRGDRVTIIDVREPHEWQIANLAPYGARLIPLGRLAERMHELDSANEIVLHCRSGVRSARALEQLRAAGFRRLWNLKGGILAWQEEVDPSLPRY
ncbi:MAG: molybdopterin-synthase adenylyltransferase MoeB [Gemmatimonadetes bacterium]|nr:molybdopterin-synthase adenylyltransferase MoeB [Gemmatimonadota bacterium]